MAHLLDTSALLAHCRQEKGAERVRELFDNEDEDIFLCSVSLSEFARISRAAAARLPLVDALIASSARSRDAVLVHRDSYMRAIPAKLVRQLDLDRGL